MGMNMDMDMDTDMGMDMDMGFGMDMDSYTHCDLPWDEAMRAGNCVVALRFSRSSRSKALHLPLFLLQ